MEEIKEIIQENADGGGKTTSGNEGGTPKVKQGNGKASSTAKPVPGSKTAAKSKTGQETVPGNSGMDNPEQTRGTEKKGNNADKVEKIFKAYPEAVELYFTSDGYAFFKLEDARRNANNLKDAEIETVKKEN
jgi:hypothetical protein